MKISSYKELEAYKKSYELVKLVSVNLINYNAFDVSKIK